MGLNQIFLSTEITWQTALVRILFSFIIGAIIGVEREAHNQPAGLRTHILISVGATLVMLLSIYIPQTYTNFQNGDPGRIAAQVVSGIGFLGAGAILRFGFDVKGLTTAASIWTMAALGLTAGAGMYMVTIFGVLVVFFALTFMEIFERKIFKGRLQKKVELLVKKKNSDINLFLKLFDEMDVRVNSSGFERNASESNDKLTFIVGVTRKTDIRALAEKIEANEGVVSVSVEMIL